MTQKAVESKIIMLKSDPGFADPDTQMRYLEWVEDVNEERQPKSAQQKWEDGDEETLIRLRVQEGLPTKEIAARMHRTPKAIERKWSKLRKKLDLPPTVPSKSGGRAAPLPGPVETPIAVGIEELLEQVQSAANAASDPLHGQNVVTYRAPVAPASNRKRKRDPASAIGGLPLQDTGMDGEDEYMHHAEAAHLGVPIDESPYKRVKYEDDAGSSAIHEVGLLLHGGHHPGPTGVPGLPVPAMALPHHTHNHLVIPQGLAGVSGSATDLYSVLVKMVAESGPSATTAGTLSTTAALTNNQIPLIPNLPH